MENDTLLKKVEELISPVCESIGYHLVEREFTNEMGRWTLRLYIERDDGNASIDDCARVSHAVEGLLDVENLIASKYYLEVSSPGLNRPLRRESDFQKYAGAYIHLKTKDQIDGRQNYKGILKGFQDGMILMEIDEMDYTIPYDQLLRAKVEHKF